MNFVPVRETRNNIMPSCVYNEYIDISKQYDKGISGEIQKSQDTIRTIIEKYGHSGETIENFIFSSQTEYDCYEYNWV